MKGTPLLPAITALVAVVGALAQVPSIVNYQGRLSVGGSNVFDGPGQFKFALVSSGTNINRRATAVATVSGGFLTAITVTSGGAGYLETPAVVVTDPTGSNVVAKANLMLGMVTSIDVLNPGRGYTSPTVTIAPPPPFYVYGTFWSNDGSSAAGAEPAHAVSVQVSQGAFAVNLGDTSVSNMTAALAPDVFTNADVRLRIWFSDGGTNGFQQFYPDQPLTAVPYAMIAANVPRASITSANLAPGAVQSSALAPGSVGVAALAADSVGAAALAPNAVRTPSIFDGSVTAAKLAMDPASLTKVSGGFMFSADGRLGVGTAYPLEKLDLGNNGSVLVSANPPDDSTPMNVGYKLAARAAAGRDITWAIYTAAVGGGWGVPPNSLSTWQYPRGDIAFERLTILPALPEAPPAPVTIDSAGKVKAAAFEGDGAGLSNISAPGVPSAMAVFTTSGTWVKPTTVSRVHVKLWGAGGGGGRGNYASYPRGNGGGGGGGGYSEGVVIVTGNVQVFVGVGGSSSEPSSDGGASQFLSLSASGGKNGEYGGLGDAGGAGGTAAGGSLTVPGKDGDVSRNGGAAFWGGLGGRFTSGAEGEPGGFPGGGGGGGGIHTDTMTSYSGGRGASGLVIVYY